MKTMMTMLASAMLLAAPAMAEDVTDLPPTATKPMPSTEIKENMTPYATLKDGTKVQFGADGMVSKVDASGRSTTMVTDGTYMLKDGTSFTVKNGKRMN